MLSLDVRGKLIGYGVVCTVVAALFGGVYVMGVRHGTQEQLKKQQVLQAGWDSQQQAAQQQYIEKLQAAQAEKDKWYAFAQQQSGDLVKANQALEAARAALKQDIAHAIKNDEQGGTVCYGGLGADSLRLYNQALGYADSEH